MQFTILYRAFQNIFLVAHNCFYVKYFVLPRDGAVDSPTLQSCGLLALSVVSVPVHFLQMYLTFVITNIKALCSKPFLKYSTSDFLLFVFESLFLLCDQMGKGPILMVFRHSHKSDHQVT